MEYNADKIWNESIQEKKRQKNHEGHIHVNLVKGKIKIQSDKPVYPKWPSSHIFQPA